MPAASYFNVLVALVLSSFQLPQVSKAMTLEYDQIPKLVENQNKKVGAARSKVEAKRSLEGFLSRSFMPELSAEIGKESFAFGSVEPSMRDYWKISASLNLYRGEQDHLTERINKESTRQSTYDYLQSLQRETLIAQQIFWTLTALEKRSELLEQKQKALQIQIAKAKQRARAGVAPQTDSLQFEIELANIENHQIEIKLEQDALKNELALTLGLQEHKTLQLNSSFPSPEPIQSEIAPEKHPRVLLAEAQRDQHQLKAQLKSGWWKPELNLYTSYGVSPLSDEYSRALQNQKEWLAGVQLSFKVGAALQKQAEARSHSLNAQSLDQSRNYEVDKIEALTHELEHDLNTLNSLITKTRAQIKKAELVLKLTQQEYDRGVKNGPDMLSATSALFDLRKQMTEWNRRYQSKKAELHALNP